MPVPESYLAYLRSQLTLHPTTSKHSLHHGLTFYPSPDNRHLFKFLRF